MKTSLCLKGERTFRLGDRIKIRVDGCDWGNMRPEFSLADVPQTPSKPGAESGKRRAGDKYGTQKGGKDGQARRCKTEAKKRRKAAPRRRTGGKRQKIYTARRRTQKARLKKCLQTRRLWYNGMDMKKTIAVNRQASYEYFIEEKFEAGIVLEGAEVKSLRRGNCNLKDSFCFLHGGEMFIKNMHIAVYDKAARSTRTIQSATENCLCTRPKLRALRAR